MVFFIAKDILNLRFLNLPKIAQGGFLIFSSKYIVLSASVNLKCGLLRTFDIFNHFWAILENSTISWVYFAFYT